MKRNSFVLYTDVREDLSLLTLEEKGRLLDAIFAYADEGVAPTGLPVSVQIVFSFIRRQMRRDMEKYERTCEARREAGKRGGLKRAENEANQANASFAEQTQAKQADNDNEPDNDPEPDPVYEPESKPDSVSEREPEPERAGARAHTPAYKAPNVFEVKDYARKEHLDIDAERFCDYYESIGWTVRGSPIHDWRAIARNWARSESTQTGFSRYPVKPQIPKGASGRLGEEEKEALRRMLAQPPDGS